MKRKRRELITPGVTLLMLWLVIGVVATSAQQLTGREAPLNPIGQVHELYRDKQGTLWASDYFAGEIWRIESNSAKFTVYEGLYGVSSGQVDGSGALWWADFDGNALGRLLPGQSNATIWPLPPGGNPLGLVVDDMPQLWLADVAQPHLLRINPAGSQLCRYDIPGGGRADYIQYRNGAIWLGDTALGRILRLDIGSNKFKAWNLATGSYPQGLTFDDEDSLWWADNGLGLLGRLKTSNNSIVGYTVPTSGSKPRMVAYDEGLLWYTDDVGTVGSLDPSQAQGAATTVLPIESPVQPACSSLGQAKSVPVKTRTGSVQWGRKSYPVSYNSGGWQVFQLPQGALPWGLATHMGDVWFADQGNGDTRLQQLGWLNTSWEDEYTVFLPVTLRN